MHKIKIEQFEGPLDLLLQLIEQQELDITAVSLATVTDQYLENLLTLEERNPEELSDFLVVASKLLLIKSKALLPSLIIDEEETAEELERQLKMYKAYVEASQKVNAIISKKRFTFVRQKPLVQRSEGFSPPEKLAVEAMALAMKKVIANLKPFIPLPKAVIEKTVSIHEKIGEIKEMIINKATVSFRKVLGEASTKTEAIVSFLALLELVKRHTVFVEQNNLFSDITINRTG